MILYDCRLTLNALWYSLPFLQMDLKTQALPLARIKKIMKLDEDVKMISAEAPMLFAKAAEIFIHELTLRAWIHTEDNKRRTLQVAYRLLDFTNFYIIIGQLQRRLYLTHKISQNVTFKEL